MTVESTTTKVRYQGNGAAVEFPTGFAFAQDSHVRAVLRRPSGAGHEDLELALGQDYALCGAGGVGQGTLAYPLAGAPLAEGETLTICQRVPITQEKSWGDLDVIDTAEIEKADDKLTRICLQLGEALERCVRMPVAAEHDPADPEELLAAATTAQTARDAAVAAAAGVGLPPLGGADAFLAVDGDGNGLEYAGDADARSKLGLGSAALADTGTGEGDVPVLDAGGLLDPGLLADMTGDAGSGGARGLVPAPGAGDAGKVLLGSGAWGTPAGVPPGCVAFLGADAVPSGWLECDGAAVSRAAYAELFAAIGTIHGAGDGSTTFNLPDLRGRFVRGWDHGAGLDPGRTLGSAQDDAFKSHSHSCAQVSSPTGNDNGGVLGYCSGSSTGAAGGTETRPKNTALLPIIKY